MRVQVANTDLAMIEALHSTWGGSFYLYCEKRHNRADAYHWILAANQAAEMLVKIEPYLITKKHLAKIAIEFQSRLRKKIGHNSTILSDEENVIRCEYFKQVKSLNGKSRKWANH